MIIRALEDRDLEELKQIHEKFYKKEFELPNFMNMICAFAVIENDQIITVGGVRAIAESIILTNKDVNNRMRAKGLRQTLEVTEFITRKSGYDQVHAFIQDKIWEKRLKKEGFATCKGSALFLNV